MNFIILYGIYNGLGELCNVRMFSEKFGTLNALFLSNGITSIVPVYLIDTCFHQQRNVYAVTTLKRPVLAEMKHFLHKYRVLK